ncbi:leiomodin-2a [Betta splendens]|uniref:Leiomodin-3 n=1 Tax=Betta splendens TaxID=158456 RepID=A0A6P7MSC9_BETSP|nr:leiomodin-2a [Betta splendens]
MSTFEYRRKLKKYEELDEDELLAALSPEELQELERELDDLEPDDNVPIGLRQKDQTAKSPTGVFDREALLKYWESENRQEMEAGTLGSSQEGRPDNSRGEQLSTGSSSNKPSINDRKKSFNKGTKAPGRCTAQVAEAQKTDGGKKEAPFRSKCHQKTQTSKVRQTESPEQDAGASGNPTVIDEALQQVLDDDPTRTEVNLNNMEAVSQETLLRFAEALCSNSHVHVFSLSNTHADDRVAAAVSKMLRENRSVRNLNIESNYVSGQGLLTLLAALQHNRTLVELRFHNQRHICGGKVEMEMVQLLRENTTLLKLGYQFELPGPRLAATGILTRNQDRQRQRRLQQRMEQSPEVPGPGGGPCAQNRAPKQPPQPPKADASQKRCPPPPDATTRKIAELVKQHEGSNGTKGQNQRKPKSKKAKNSGGEDGADILKELRSGLKPSLQRRREEAGAPPPQRCSRDDLMAAIRGSSVRSLRRVDPAQT